MPVHAHFLTGKRRQNDPQACKQSLQILSPISITILPDKCIYNTDTDLQKLLAILLPVLFAAEMCIHNSIAWHFPVVKTIFVTTVQQGYSLQSSAQRGYRQMPLHHLPQAIEAPLRRPIHVSRPWMPCSNMPQCPYRRRMKWQFVHHT